MLTSQSESIKTNGVLNVGTINLTRQLLFREDYVNFETHLKDVSNVKNFLEYLLDLLIHGRLSDFGSELDANRRARRLMLKIITITPTIPTSLFVTGVIVKADFIGGGGYGLVVKGELGGGAVVALKALYKPSQHNFTVSYSRTPQLHRLYISVQIVFLSRGIDMAIPQSQIRPTLDRNLRRSSIITPFPCFAVHEERHSSPMANESNSFDS